MATTIDCEMIDGALDEQLPRCAMLVCHRNELDK